MEDDDLKDLIRTSVRQALERPASEVEVALAEFGWRELAASDEAFAFTALFEEQGRLAADTDALDLAVAAALGIDGPITVLWPLRSSPVVRDLGGSGRAAVDGVALRDGLGDGRRVLVPVHDRIRLLVDPSLVATALGGMASGSRWVRVRGEGARGDDVGSWPEIERRGRLAMASELVGVTQRILDVAADQVTTRRQFGRPIGANQAVRFRLAEAYADLAGARALIAAAWEEGSPEAAACAKVVAATAHDAVAKHAIQVCGAIGLSEEHPLPALVRRGFALAAIAGTTSLHVPPTASVGRF